MSFSLILPASLLLCLALAGCGPQVVSAPDTDGKDVTASPTPGNVVIEAMLPSQIREQIAPNFPVEVPVPLGTVARGASQGEDAWDYELVVDAPPATLADWYRDAYSNRSWQVLQDEVSGSADLQRYEITFRKAAAESRVVVSTERGAARALVVLGVGAPVLQTQ